VVRLKYTYSQEFTERAHSLCDKLCFKHIDKERVSVIISTGSKTRRTIARIHAMGKAMQLGLKQKPAYVIELISEKFFKQSEEEQTKTLIHELMHIPHSFGGGFRHHKPYVNRKTVEEEYEKLKAFQ